MIQFCLAIFICTFCVSVGGDEIKNILSKMDVTDKCGQMTQITIDVVQKDEFLLNEDPIDIIKLKEAIQVYKIGSLQNTPNTVAQKGEIWQTIIKHIHDISLNTSLKIPLIYGKFR